MRVVRIGERLVGEAQPCFLAAEVVTTTMETWIWPTGRSTLRPTREPTPSVSELPHRRFPFGSLFDLWYVSQGKTVVEPQFDMFKRCELAPEKLLELREHCDRRDVIFFSTPTSEEGIRELIAIGVPLLKNGSDYLVNLPLIRGMARTGLPTVISTGMATFDDVQDAVEAFRGAGGKDLILLHCTSSYPTPPEDVHLRKISALSAAFDCAVGLSDHTEGNVAAIGSVALGACLIEKHFTLDKNLPGPDHRFSADPTEFRTLVESVRSMEKSLGSAELKPAASDQLGRSDYRLSCVAARELPAGRRLVASDIAFRRPGFGFPPKELDRLIARELVKGVPPGHVFSPEDFA